MNRSTHSIDNRINPEIISIPFGENDTLRMTRLCRDPEGTPVFMLHGMIENSAIFCSRKGRGLGPFLADHGYDVYMADLRGRGKSTPPVGRHSNHGQTESILYEVPAFIKKIIEIRGTVTQKWIAHSWGGVILNSVMARFPEYAGMVDRAVYFGAKRRVAAVNRTRLARIDFIWGLLCSIAGLVCGYLPAKKMRIGSDNEPRMSHLGCVRWVYRKRWVDPVDGFDYGEAAKTASLPPVLYLAAVNDRCLGHPADVKRTMDESCQDNAAYRVLGKEYGNLHDYDHVSMLTHPDAVRDHFPIVLQWLCSAGPGRISRQTSTGEQFPVTAE